MNTKRLYQLSGVSLIISGLLFVIIQIIHPSNELANIRNTPWMVTHIITFLFPIFGLFGLTGVFLKGVHKESILNLVGYVLLSGAFIFMIVFGFLEAFVLPGLIEVAPSYVESAESILDGETGPIYIGILYQINGVLYMLGGLTFGLALFFNKVFPKVIAWAMIVALVMTLSAAVLPFMARISGAAFGLVCVGLGYLLITELKWFPKSLK